MIPLGHYIPGKGYEDGWLRRMRGDMDESVHHSVRDPYWLEYRAGYWDAHERVLKEAREKFERKTDDRHC